MITIKPDARYRVYCEITDVLLANIEILEDCYTLFSNIYIVTVILEYSDHLYTLGIGCPAPFCDSIPSSLFIIKVY